MPSHHFIYDTFVNDFPKDDKGHILLDEVIQKQNVLLVLTGDQLGLSAPLSFNTIKARALPLARDDVSTDDGIDIIRVSMWTAMQFIVDLERREEAAFPELGLPNLMLVAYWVDDSIRWVIPDDRADEVMQEAAEKGIQNVRQMKHAIQDIREREERGECRYPHREFLDIAPAISGPCGIREYCHVRFSPIRHEVSHHYSSMATT